MPESDPLLHAYLAGHDVLCPRCDAPLRDVRDATCPKCGATLALGLQPAGASPRQITIMLALAIPFGFASILLGMMIWMGIRQGLGDQQWPFTIASGVVVLTFGAAIVVAVRARHRFFRHPPATQRILVIGAIVAAALAFGGITAALLSRI